MSRLSIQRMRNARSVTAETQKSTPVAWENPLIPNKKLRAMYVAMVQLRLLQQYAAKLRNAQVHPGEEGCRVSTTFDLKSGDLTSEVSSGLATSFLRGARLAELLHPASRKTTREGSATERDARGQLPAASKTADRLNLAMGAAFALKATRKGALLVAYGRSDEAAIAEWKPVLRFVAEHVLPVIFVILPGSCEAQITAKPGQLSLASSKIGVPGIPVDAADPVALYRVAQESMLRVRAGGGPVLMECIAFRLSGRTVASADPIETMRSFLLGRKISEEAWLEDIEPRFRTRLQAAAR